MLTRKPSVEGKTTLSNTAQVFENLDASAAQSLAIATGDITLVLDDTGAILDCSLDPRRFPAFDDWIGQSWLDTVTIESRGKLMEMLAASRRGEVQHWRQVNHPSNDGDIPVRYVLIASGEQRIAIGQDLREVAKVQQRLLQVQQSLERDYMRLRQTESRYRMLFEMLEEPIMIIDIANQRVHEANSAACKLLGEKEGRLTYRKVLNYFDKSSRDALVSLFGSALAADRTSPVDVKTAKKGEPVTLYATGFIQDRLQYLIVRISVEGKQSASEASSPVIELLKTMPDAFVIADKDMRIISANLTFVELVNAASLDQLRNKPLGDFVGRPGIDLELIKTQIEQHGSARNVSSIVRNKFDSEEGEQVELSAVYVDDDQPVYGFVIRSIARRLRDLPPSTQDLPRSVEQLTDLVGRMSLKDIVRESTDLIERLCIEAALSYTSDNRASAAEILGLSRQSLYSKLHRHGLGNLGADGE